jgi:hypothetical protein
MRMYMRIVFALNAVYQIALGVLCLLGPSTAVAIYGGSDTDHCSTLLLVTFRLLGVYMIPAGVISVVIAADPDRHPVLRTLTAVLATLTLVCWGIVVGMHDVSASQVAGAALSVVIQVALLVGAIGYFPRAVVQQVVVRRSRGLAA